MAAGTWVLGLASDMERAGHSQAAGHEADHAVTAAAAWQGGE